MKIFDTEKFVVRNVKEPQMIRVDIDSSWLDLPIAQMMEKIYDIIRVEFCTGSSKSPYVYVKCDIVGESNKSDIEDLYVYIESAITKLFCSGEEREAQKERLGVYGLPKLNMKTVNLLKWVKYHPIVKGIGLEVGQKNGFWKKRLIK